jgi:D-threo-aldose 1-dehydrogenase
MDSTDPRLLDRYVQGTSQLGGLYSAVDEATAEATLERAWALGVRHFDTAPHYGTGLSERRVGRFLAQKPRDEFTLSTKVGRLLVPGAEPDPDFAGDARFVRRRDYSRDGVLRSFEDSLARLGLDRIDTLYLHDPDADLDQAIGEGYPALAELRDQGVVAHVGVGTNGLSTLERVVRETDADQIMLAGRYTLMDRSAAERLLPLCQAKGVRVVAVAVYAGGLLAHPGPGAYYLEAIPATDAQIAQALALQDVCRSFGVPLTAAAAQFPLRHPAVTAVGLGTRTAAQAEQNVANLSFPVPDALWEALS